MPLSRFTTRRLMALVAILAVLLGAEQIVRQSADYHKERAAQVALQEASLARFRETATAHASSEAICREMFQVCAKQAEALRKTDAAASSRLQESAARYAERAAYHARMRKKYESAMPYPWLPVPPDPPPPM